MTLEKEIIARIEELAIENKDLQQQVRRQMYIKNGKQRELFSCKQEIKRLKRHNEHLQFENKVSDTVARDALERIGKLLGDLKKGVSHFTENEVVRIIGWFRGQFGGFSGDINEDRAALLGQGFIDFYQEYITEGRKDEK